MTLTAEQAIRFRNDWTQEQINAFGQRIASATTIAKRRAIIAEFNANLPNPAYGSHPQAVQLQAACARAAAQLRSGQA